MSGGDLDQHLRGNKKAHFIDKVDAAVQIGSFYSLYMCNMCVITSYYTFDVLTKEHSRLGREKRKKKVLIIAHGSPIPCFFVSAQFNFNTSIVPLFKQYAAIYTRIPKYDKMNTYVLRVLFVGRKEGNQRILTARERDERKLRRTSAVNPLSDTSLPNRRLHKAR